MQKEILDVKIRNYISKKVVSLGLNEQIEYFDKCIILNDMRDTIDRTLIWMKNRGDSDCTTLFVEEYDPFIKRIVNNDTSMSSYFIKGIEREDLVQTGMVGVLESMLKYDFRKNVKVRTYMNSMIRFAIKNDYRNYDQMTVSRHAKSIFTKFINKYGDFDNGIKDSCIKELKEEYGYEENDIKNSINAVIYSNSLFSYELDGKINCDEKTLVNTNNRIIEEYNDWLNTFMEYNMILDFINSLIGPEKYVMNEVYIEDLTQKEVAKKMKKSVASVNKIKQKSIRKIQKMISK